MLGQLFGRFFKSATDPLKEKSPPSSATDKNVDALSLCEARLQKLTTLIDVESTTWENIKIELERDEKEFLSHSHEIEKKESFLTLLKAFVLELEELAESPAYYLRHLIEKIEPQVDRLRNAIHTRTDASAVSCKNVEHIELCHEVLMLIHAIQALLNNVRGEIIYCLDFEKLSEPARQKLLEYTLFATTGIMLNLDDPDALTRYRYHIYDQIHKDVSHIETIITSAQGDIEHAKKYLSNCVPSPPQLASDAVDVNEAKESIEPPLRRYNSASI